MSWSFVPTESNINGMIQRATATNWVMQHPLTEHVIPPNQSTRINTGWNIGSLPQDWGMGMLGHSDMANRGLIVTPQFID